MNYLFFISLLLFSSCNIYELVENGNQYSDSFEDLLARPSVSFKPQQLSLSKINSASSAGVNIEFKISNAQFNDFSVTGTVDHIPEISQSGPGSVNNLTISNSAIKTSPNSFTINAMGNSATLTGELFLKISIPVSSYTSNSNLDLVNEDYFVKLVP